MTPNSKANAMWPLGSIRHADNGQIRSYLLHGGHVGGATHMPTMNVTADTTAPLPTATMPTTNGLKTQTLSA